MRCVTFGLFNGIIGSSHYLFMLVNTHTHKPRKYHNESHTDQKADIWTHRKLELKDYYGVNRVYFFTAAVCQEAVMILFVESSLDL